MTAEYGLGIDLGTTHTAAAVRTGGRAESVRLGTRRMEIPSAVFVKDDGELLFGEAAERRGQDEPGRLAREFKRRLGDPVPILAGGVPFSAHALTAKLLRHVLDTVARQQDGPPAEVTLTYPAHWGPYKREQLDQAIRLADTGPVRLLSEPEAVAQRHAAAGRIEPGATVVVYDLGGGTLDVAVLRRDGDRFTLLGTPEGVDQLGGADFDEAVLAHILGTLDGGRESVDPDDPETAPALARLRRDCVEAKESLSFDSEVTVPIALPGRYTRVRLHRSEFEAMITPSVRDTVDATRRALRSAGVEPAELSAVLLAGGSSRIPLIARVLGAEFERPVIADSHPEHSVALGAALHLSGPVPAAVAPAAAPPVPAAVATDTALADVSPANATAGATAGAAATEPAEPAYTAPAAAAPAAAPATTVPNGAAPAFSGPAVSPARGHQADFTDLRTPADPWAAAEAAEAAAALAAAAEASTTRIPVPRSATRIEAFDGTTQADAPSSPAPVSALGPASGLDVAEPSTQFVPTTYAPPSAPAGNRRRTLVIAGVAVVALAAAATGVALSNWPDGERSNAGPSTAASPSVAGPAPLPTDTMLVRMDTGGDMGDRATWKPRIFFLSPDGDTRRELPGTEAGDVLPRWSNNRQLIALTHREAGGKNAIFLMDRNGNDRSQFAEDVTGGRVAWSADDTRIAYVKQVRKVNQIFVQPIAGGDAEQLTSSKAAKDDPVWSPDGRSIIYWAENDGVRSVFELNVADPQEPGRPITPAGLGEAVDPAISPKGDKVLFTKKVDDENTDIWMIGTDGSQPEQVTSKPEREMDPTWSPNGEWFAFVRGDLNHPKVVVQRADGTGEQTLTKGDAREGHPCWF
ncbi:Hsp70 family protein [Actinoplanes sp. GCM10030250]|uniref:Hsp70 family protein n=1 Tax=Actinoplanes sp. GCM10030250 TaxID=3273376 RepID=UPI00361B6229